MKMKISDHQLFALAAVYTIGDTVISASSNVAAYAQQDAWISALITTILGFPFLWVYAYLAKLYPGKTLVDMLESVFGKWAGWIISAIFVVFVCFIASWQVMSYIGNFVQTEYMTETPLYALNFLLTIALVVGIFYGLEAIARSAEVFVVIVTVLMLLTILLNMKNIKVENLLPILEKGIVPSLKGSLYLSSFTTWPFVFMLTIYPFNTDDTLKTRNSLFLGYLWGVAITFVCTIMAISVLGSTITARSLYPTYLMAKEIGVGIITRIEGLVALSWILSEYIRTFLYFYAGMAGFCQLFKIKNYRRIVLPLGLVTLIFSGVIYPTAAYQTKWDTTTWVVYMASFGGIVPILMVIINKIKSRLKSSTSVQEGN